VSKLVLVIVVFAAMLVESPPANAAWTWQTTPVIFVHGFSINMDLSTGGVDCHSTWGDLKQKMLADGVTAPLRRVQFYANDSNCDVNLASLHDRGTCPYNSELTSKGYATVNTRIQEIACMLAWYIHDTYTANGKPVNIEAHSMGGLISTYMLDAVNQLRAGFPNHLWVNNVISAGTPYTGARTLGSWDGVGFDYCVARGVTECEQMAPGSDFIAYIENQAKPHSIHQDGSTNPIEWTALGSAADAAVGADSAVGFVGIDHAYKYASDDNIGHNDYMHDFSQNYNDDGDWFNPGNNTWYYATNLAHPGNIMELGLQAGE
jgi:hypothetical protein